MLPAAIAARAAGCGVICPAVCGGEAAWSGVGNGSREGLDAGDADRPPIIAAPSLLALINHLRGKQMLPPPEALMAEDRELPGPCRDQGSGECQARPRNSGGRRPQPADDGAARLRQVDAGRALARPVATARTGGSSGILDGALAGRRAWRRPAEPPPRLSRSAPLGGACRWRPPRQAGEVSLAHHGVLFDELPELGRAAPWRRCASRSKPDA